MKQSGRCLCGAVRFRFEGQALWCGHCHCQSCRRATASPFTTFVGVNKDRLVFDAEPLHFASSPGVTRFFCGTCGTPMGYENDARPGQVDLYAATFDDAAALKPEYHEHTDEMLPWIHLADGLPHL